MMDSNFVSPAALTLAVLIRHYLNDLGKAVDEAEDALLPFTLQQQDDKDDGDSVQPRFTRALQRARQRRCTLVYFLLKHCHSPPGFTTLTLPQLLDAVAKRMNTKTQQQQQQQQQRQQQRPGAAATTEKETIERERIRDDADARVHIIRDVLTKLHDINSVHALFAFFDDIASLLLPHDHTVPVREEGDMMEALSPAEKAERRRGLVQPSSLFGMYIRKLVLVFKRMMFAGVVRLYDALDFYRKDGVASIMLHGSEEQRLCIEELQLELLPMQAAEQRTHQHHSKVVTTLCRHHLQRFLHNHASTIAASVGRVPSDHTTLIVDELHDLSPTEHMPETYFVRYLHALHHREFEVAIESLHRYFDHSAQQQRRQRRAMQRQVGASAGGAGRGLTSMLQYSILTLGMLHFAFGHEAEALRAVTETVRIAQQNNDRTCLLHALTMLGQLQGADIPRLRDASAGISSSTYAHGLGTATDRGSKGQSTAMIMASSSSTPTNRHTATTAQGMMGGKHSMEKLREMLCRCLVVPDLYVLPGGGKKRHGGAHGGGSGSGRLNAAALAGLPPAPSEVDIRAWLALVTFDLRHGTLGGAAALRGAYAGDGGVQNDLQHQSTNVSAANASSCGNPRTVLASLANARQLCTYFEQGSSTHRRRSCSFSSAVDRKQDKFDVGGQESAVDGPAFNSVIGAVAVLYSSAWRAFGSSALMQGFAEMYLRFHSSIHAGGVARDFAAALCYVVESRSSSTPESIQELLQYGRAQFPYAARNGLEDRLCLLEFERACDAGDAHAASKIAGRIFAMARGDSSATDTSFRGEVLFVEAQLHFMEGRMMDARSTCSCVLVYCAAQCDVILAARCLLFLTKLHVVIGKALDALPHALHCLSLCQAVHAYTIKAEVHIVLARVHLILGSPRRGLETIRTVLSQIMKHARASVRVEALAVMAQCLLGAVGSDLTTAVVGTGWRGGVKDNFNDAGVLASLFQKGSSAPPLLRAVGRVAMSDVLGLLLRAREVGESAGTYMSLREVYYLLARVYHEVGNVAERDKAAASFHYLT